MVILKELYSETGLINKVSFRKGLNIILGRYSNKENKEINGIGKSYLIRLIDFCLLSSDRKGYFSTKKYPFLKEHSISLKVEIDNDEYVITRFFSNKSKVKFTKVGEIPTEFFTQELKDILGNKFFKPYYPTYYEPPWYRRIIKFFIKDDIEQNERRDPPRFVSLHTRKNEYITYNLYLWGLPNEKLYKLDQKKKELEIFRNQKNKLKKDIETEYNASINQLKSKISVLEARVKEIEKIFEEYEFAETFKDLEDKLVFLSNEISKKLVKIQKLEKNLSYIRESYNVNIEIDVNETTKYYEILKKELGEFLKKNLEDIIQFRKAISENRRKYLISKEQEIENELKKLWKEYYKLEKERSDIYKILDAKGKFSSLKEMYKKFIEELAEYENLKQKLEILNEIEIEIQNIKREIEELYYKIVEEYESYKPVIEKINMEFVKTTKMCTKTYEGSYLWIQMTENIESPIDIDIGIPKELSYGRTNLKLVLYDLTLFKNILENNKPMPHFLIHDGVFHGIDDKTKIRTLNFINDILQKYQDAQYITTFNEDEIPKIYEDENLKFNYKDKVIAVYEDSTEKTLFGRFFS